MESITTTSMSTTSYSATDVAAVAAISVGTILIMAFVFFGAYAIQAIFTMQLFKKAKVARWKAWVPFVNTWTLLQIGGQKGAWILPSIIGGIFSYILLGFAGITGAIGDTANAGTGVAVGGLAITAYLVAIVGAVLTIIFNLISVHNIDKKLGWSGGMLVLYIFFPLIWLGIAGLGGAKYDDKKGQPSLAKKV